MNANTIDPVTYVNARLAGRPFSKAARMVAQVVAERLILRDGEWRTIGLRKREIADVTGLSADTIQAARRDLATGDDAIFTYKPGLEADLDGKFVNVRAWHYSLRLPAGDSHAPLQRRLESPGEHGRRGGFSVSCTLDGPPMTSVLSLEITERDRVDDAEEAALAERRARNDRQLKTIFAEACARDDREMDPRRLFDAE